jgi:DNA-binding transcriptional ArsR family regulator
MPLEDLFGETPVVKVLDFLIAHEDFDYTKKEIAEHTGMSRMTLHRHWEKLERAEIVKESRQIGRAQLFKLNKENKVTQELMEFAWGLTKLLGKKIAEEEIAKEEMEKSAVEKAGGLA